MNLFSPAEVANNYIATGKSKVSLSIPKLLILGALAGLFIGLSGVASATATVSIAQPSVAKLVGAAVFPGGLSMVLVAGSELFTGNSLLVVPLLQREIKVSGMLKNWCFVYLGNFIGSALASLGAVLCHQYSLFGNGMAVAVISTAVGKVTLTFGDALIRGILCNFLVCTAVWMTFAAKDVAGKIIGLFFPVMMFVLCGFEHSVANMYYITGGLFAKAVPAYAAAAIDAGIDLSALTWGNFLLGNLLPVTLGNLIGGCAVGTAYWFCYLRKK